MTGLPDHHRHNTEERIRKARRITWEEYVQCIVHYSPLLDLREVLFSILRPEAGLEDIAADVKSQRVKLHY